MGEDKKPDHLKLISGGSPEDIFDDIEGLRKVAELKVQRRAVAVNMSVLRKPPDNGYFQCHLIGVSAYCSLSSQNSGSLCSRLNWSFESAKDRPFAWSDLSWPAAWKIGQAASVSSLGTPV
jgi:hypothetical protein